MIIELPFPPSSNTYWRVSHTKRRFYICKEGLIYRQNVQNLTLGCKTLTGPLEIDIKFFPPDRRVRDIDNYKKCLYDSLQHAGVIVNDKQFRKETSEFFPPVAKGKVILEITKRDKE